MMNEVTTLEEAPGSKGKQLAVAEIIDAQSDEDKQALKVLAESRRRCSYGSLDTK
jgi:hypothetical protein